MRTRFYSLIAAFDRQQAEADQRFKAAIEDERRTFEQDYDRKISRAVLSDRMVKTPRGEPTLTDLFNAEKCENGHKHEAAMKRRSIEYAAASKVNRAEFIRKATAHAQGELTNRIGQRRAAFDIRLATAKASHDLTVNQRLAKITSDFERAEVDRLAAHQENAERAILEVVKSEPNRAAPEASRESDAAKAQTL